MTPHPPPPRVVILGGGTAGWMAANLLAHRWSGRCHVTLVESPEIGIIGVGEGSTPQLKAFFDTLGIAEAEWMPRCNATYKNGISFHGWAAPPGPPSYFHPFATALDIHTAPAFFARTQARRAGHAVEAHPDRFFVAARLAAEARGPVPAQNFPFDIGYGYHFDAHLVGAFLREHAVKAGVTHLERRVASVAVGENGRITHLQTEGGDAIEADLFVDSSGFRATLIGEGLGVAFHPFAANLFNDRAVVMPTPAGAHGPAAQTRATAMRAGWAWDIPLTNRTGNGYVYSSRYLSRDEAEAELRAHLGPAVEGVAARHLEMKVGRVARAWEANCLAVGLAQGFIEPLEATALHIVQATVEGFIGAWDAGGEQHRDAFNASIAARFEGVRDYIVCHYKVNRRPDTQYWRDNAVNDHLSDSLKSILTCWFTGGDLSAEIERQNIARYYAPLSWHTLLAGYGVYPPERHPAPPAAAREMAAVDDFIARAATNFPAHTALLARATLGLAA